MEQRTSSVAIVIPCFRVREHISKVLSRIGPECNLIFVVDDACPEGTGDFVESNCSDQRVQVLRHQTNQGVGGATITGYKAALRAEASVIVKLDGDGQMDPAMIPSLVAPVLDGRADYVKGNRFFHPGGLRSMPWLRLIGNSILSFATKLSSGYWNIFDPTNGFTAIHSVVAKGLPLGKISRRWFFESDMLFHLGILRAVVRDIPMPAAYQDETSTLVIRQVVPEFMFKHLANVVKRIFYGYFLRDFNFASIELVLGLLFSTLGGTFGVVRWIQVLRSGISTTSGSVMLAALPIIIGVQLLLSFLNYDLQRVPHEPLQKEWRRY